MWPRFVSRGKQVQARAVSSVCRLQCGRGLLAAESLIWIVRICVIVAASMWPRFVSRGKGDWKEKDGIYYSASMWPRFVSRGKQQPAEHN